MMSGHDKRNIKLLFLINKMKSTFLADVFRLKVGEEVFLARVKVVQDGVWNGNDAVSSTGAAAIHVM